MPDTVPDPVLPASPAPEAPEPDPLLSALSETRAELARVREELVASRAGAVPVAPAAQPALPISPALTPRQAGDAHARARTDAQRAASAGDRRALLDYLRLRREPAAG